MKNRTRITAASAACAFALSLAAFNSADAKTEHFAFALSGKLETPPNATKGVGKGTASYDNKTRELDWKVSFKGLTGDATMAHFHGPAKKGDAAGVQVSVARMGDPVISPIVGSATLTDEQAKQLESGLWYFNIHTAANPKGEIRGQVLRAHTAKPAAPPPPPAAEAPAPMPAPAPKPAAAPAPGPAMTPGPTMVPGPAMKALPPAPAAAPAAKSQ